jgi:hypothetical protein
MLDCGCHGHGCQLCRAISVNIEPLSSQQILQLLAAVGIVFDGANGSLALAQHAVGTTCLPAEAAEQAEPLCTLADFCGACTQSCCKVAVMMGYRNDSIVLRVQQDFPRIPLGAKTGDQRR